MSYFCNKPQMAMLEITTKCNLHCVYCAARKLVKTPSDLPLEKIKEMTKNLSAFEYICLCGLGESLLHKEFYEVLGLFQDKKIVLITNGSLEIDYDRLTKYNNIDAISFSIDGSTEEDMKRVSSNYRFDILLQNLERAKQYHVNVAINCTLVQDNIEKLDGLKELAIQYQVKRFKIGFPLGKSKWLKEMVEPIQEKLAHLKSGLEEAGIEFEGPLEVKCIFNGAPIAVISKNGNVYPCCDYFCGRPLVGNVFHDHFDTMWEKDSYERFRSGTYCKGCSQYHRNKTIVNLFGKQVNEADET